LRHVLKAIVFDFDGLILDTEEPTYRSWVEVYRAHGEELPFDRWLQTVGSSNAVFDPRGHLEERLGRALTDQVLDERKRRRTELVLEQAVLPGVAELAAAARDIGLKIAVASSSRRSWVTEHLDRLGILGLFECIRCRDDVQQVKPAPDLFLAALECLGVEACDSVAIEDSPNGVLAAKAAGMLCVAVPNSITAGQEDLGRADLVLPSLAGATPQSLATRLGLTLFRCESGSSPAEETRRA
jgi:HAD superfamily hydrolase (TIGR01509 family)